MTDLNPRKLMGTLRKGSSGIADLLKQKPNEDSMSKAEVIADALNIIKLDTALMARIHDVDIELDPVDEDDVAEMLGGIALGEDLSLIDEFVEMEENRERIFREALSDDHVDAFIDSKHSYLYGSGNSPVEETTEDEPEDE